MHLVHGFCTPSLSTAPVLHLLRAARWRWTERAASDERTTEAHGRTGVVLPDTHWSCLLRATHEEVSV